MATTSGRGHAVKGKRPASPLPVIIRDGEIPTVEGKCQIKVKQGETGSEFKKEVLWLSNRGDDPLEESDLQITSPPHTSCRDNFCLVYNKRHTP